MTATLDAAVAFHNSFAPGVEGAPVTGIGAPGGPAARTVGSPLPPIGESDSQSHETFADMRYANARPVGYRLAHVHVARMGADGRVWVDGDPDPAAPLRQRCPVLTCLLPRNSYSGHLCLQPDGTEVWRDWPTPTSADTQRGSARCRP